MTTHSRRRAAGREDSDAPSFVCAHCGGQGWYVIDTRFVITHDAVRRRRKCRTCGQRMSTEERILATSQEP